MGVEWLEIGVKVRKGVMFTIRGCFRSARHHPFLVGILCFLIFLYRLSPFLFQLLVSASPVLVCTAVLLGTILSFGQPHIPEIEVEEEETTVEAASIKTGVLGETAVVEENESYYVERFSERSLEERGESVEGKIVVEDSDDTAPLIEERSVETDGEIREGRREFGDLVYEQKADWIEERLSNGEILENHFASAVKVDDEVAESDDEKSDADSFGSEKVNVDSLDSPPRSPWRRAEEREDRDDVDDDDDDDDDSDSGSSRAESSSPDASMADILPMLDELHPLLDEEAPRIVHGSHDEFDAASEKSESSGTSGHEADESENREDLDVADDDNEDEDEDDEEGKKEEERKSAIAWTEEDEKNLMDLGSSEIERNQRLENLILRRRARKMFADKNLIDLDSADLPFNIAPISTRRHNNPFDQSHDYYDSSGLPPIPGSAPSVLLPRRNPFDIPYDSSEEKPDLMGDGFKEEFATSQPRESFFRRHESFNVGPSNFAPKRRDVKMRPFFVPEGSVSEESSSSIFQRQSSELSESKLSSVPDTESISSVTSVEDPEDRKLSEEDKLPEVKVIAETNDEGPSGDSELIYQQEVGLEENVHREPEMISVIYQQEVELGKNVDQEPEMISVMESVTEHVGHGSQSSEEEDSFELGHIENRDVEFIELGSQLEEVADHSDYEAVGQRYTRNSSSSSLSEVSERVFTMTEGESLSMLEGERDDVAEESRISNETSIERTNLHVSNLLINEVPHRGPVYDTSPRELSNNVSSSSISCDVHPESDLGSLPVVDRTTVSSIERESVGSSLVIETDVPSNVMLPNSSVDESQPPNVGIREHDHINTELSAVEESCISEGSSAAAGIASHVIPLDSPDEASVEEHLMEQHGWDEVPTLSADTNIHSMVKSSEDQNLEQLVSGDSPLEISELPFEGQLRADLLAGVEETVREPNFTHLNEVQASSTLVESFVDDQVTHKFSMPEVQELDQFISSNINSPLGPEFVAIPPNAFEATTSHVDEQIIVEEVDEIKEIDDVLLSELDSVGDFSIKHLGSDSVKFDTHIDSVGEANLSSLHETSSMRYFEAHSVEMNQTEDVLHSNNLRERVDMYEENMECISELQTSETSRAENIGASRMEFSENDSQGFPHQETPGQETLSTENEVQHGYSLAKHDYEDTFSMVSQPIEDVDAVPVEKTDLTSAVTEITGGGAKGSTQGQVDNDTTSAMPELEASTIEDIDLAFKQISSKEIEKPVVLEPPQAELHDSEATVSALPKVQAIQEVDADIEIPSGVLSLESNKIEDIDLTFAQISSNEIEKPAVMEPPKSELQNGIPESEVQSGEDVDTVLEKSELTFVGGAEVSSQGQVDAETVSGMPELKASTIRDIDLAVDQISSKESETPVVSESPQADLHDNEDIASGMPVSKVQSTEHVDVVLEKGESTSVETDTILGGVEVSSQVQLDTDATAGMTEHEASTFEDIGLAFEEINSKEIEKTVVSEPHNHEDTVSLVKAEFTSEVAENTVESGEISCQAQLNTETTSGMTELEARTISDIDLIFEQISSKEITKPIVLDTPEAELAIGEAATKDSEDHNDSTVTTSAREAEQIKDVTLDHVIESGETQGASNLHVAESNPSEDTTLSPKQGLDGETMNLLKLNQDDGSVEVEADKLPYVESQSPEKAEHECKSSGDSHSPSHVKGKGKVSKHSSSSSSSSSSSESISSDSDKE